MSESTRKLSSRVGQSPVALVVTWVVVAVLVAASVLALLALAEVWRSGVELRDDAEATV